MFAQRASGGRLQVVPVRCQHFMKSVSGGEHNFGDQAGVLQHQFRSQHVFEFVRELAQFSEAACSGITLERVNRTPNAAQAFLVAGAIFERESGLVHSLEDLRSALKEKIAELGGALVGEK